MNFKQSDVCDFNICLAGNPNVGKSSVFNELTGLRQHTGNWPGKTVESAGGKYTYKGKTYCITDLPGTYSLLPHSAEEEVTRDFLIFENPDAVIIVCDASCLERNLSLVLQTLEITRRCVVCVNLLDEAKRHHITVKLKKLSQKLGVPVVGTVARCGRGLYELKSEVSGVIKLQTKAVPVRYTRPIEDALYILTPLLEKKLSLTGINPRWAALRFLEKDYDLINRIGAAAEVDLMKDTEIQEALEQTNNLLKEAGVTSVSDNIASCVVLAAEDIANGVLDKKDIRSDSFDRKVDRIVTGRLFGIPIMLALLVLIFWLTVTGANYPSEILTGLFGQLEKKLLAFSLQLNIPETVYSPLIFGVYHILTRVIAVMLPPMAIFFPLFTLLEDLGYLPRIAFNLDRCFKKCSACGKQALTM